ncbi:hypothetical protein OIU74_016083, partial [Salix koriyanagi]
MKEREPQLHPKGVEQPRNDTDPDKLSCSVKSPIGSSSKPAIIGNDIEPGGRSSHSPSARGEALKVQVVGLYLETWYTEFCIIQLN